MSVVYYKYFQCYIISLSPNNKNINYDSLAKVIHVINEYLLHENEDIVFNVVLGLSKLFVLDKIHDLQLLSNLVILLYNPNISDVC